MEIRLATIDDAQAIYAIEQQSFSVPWSLESVLVELEGASNKLYMVICEENKIVGYAGAWLVYDECSFPCAGRDPHQLFRPVRRLSRRRILCEKHPVKENKNGTLSRLYRPAHRGLPRAARYFDPAHP